MMKIDLFRNATDVTALSAGTVVFREGDPGDVMYAVVEGEIVLTVGGAEVERVKSGSLFGEMALIDSRPRSATASVALDARLVKIDVKRFHFLITQTPMFATQLMGIMADRLRRMNQGMRKADPA